MRLIFGANAWPGSLLLRLATFSEWSHVAIVFPNDTIVEAHFPRVRVSTLGAFQKKYPRWELAELPCANDDAALDFAADQVGKLYDVGALFAFPFQVRDWESDGRWFCSELPVVAAAMGGTRHFRTGEMNRITPGDLYAVTT